MNTSAGMVGSTALAGSLTGHRGIDEVRRILLAPLGHGMAELLVQCLPGWDVSAGPISLLRSKYKPGRKLTGYYTVPVEGKARRLSMTWSLVPPAADGVRLGATASPVELEARRFRVLAPFTRLHAVSEDGATALLVAPADPLMPQLVRLSQPRHLATVIPGFALTAHGDVGRTTTVDTVRYRPGQRHVLRVAFPEPEGSVATAFVKLDRDDCGAKAVAVANLVGPVLAATCPTSRLAEPLAYAVSDRAALWRGVSGEPLWRLLAGGDSTRLVAHLGHALSVLHDIAPQTLHGNIALPTREAAGELASMVRAGEHLAALPEVGRSYVALARRVLDRLCTLPAEEPTFIHGDVKCDNIVIDGDRLHLLDLDRCAWGDPALDLAKILADIRWWCSGSGADSGSLTTALMAGYGRCAQSRWARAQTLAVLYQLKLAARRIPVHDATWHIRVGGQVNDAAAALDCESATP